MTSAPSAASRRDSVLACSRARVTTTERPNSGRCSIQASASRMAATGPTTVTAGAGRPSSAARPPISASAPVIVACDGSVPCETTAADSSGERPASIREVAIGSRLRTPM